MQTIPPVRPDAVLNFAALTHVDGCETDPARATRDNALGAQHVALAARACGAAVLHVSTDYVFDGMKGAPYDEMDATHPLSVYGRTKLAGEAFVRQLVPEHFIVRTSYVYGAGDDYASGALERLRRGESAGGIRDRIGSPTFVGHLASRLLPLLLTGRFGTYHVAGSEPACWFDVLERARTIGGSPRDGGARRRWRRSVCSRRVRPTPPSRAPTSSTSGSSRSRGWTRRSPSGSGDAAAEATA